MNQMLVTCAAGHLVIKTLRHPRDRWPDPETLTCRLCDHPWVQIKGPFGTIRRNPLTPSEKCDTIKP